MSSELLADLILRASRIIATDRLDASHTDNFGRLFLLNDNYAHCVFLAEIGARPGSFEIVFHVEKLLFSAVPKPELVIQGPFGMIEYTEVLFLDEQSDKLCRRADSFRLTSEFGETLIQINLNEVGAFTVQSIP